MNSKSSEMLDWVDENDIVIKPIPREVAHRDKKFTHREVAILLQNSVGAVLLQKRSRHKKVYPGVWIVSVAGHIISGGDPLHAAHKELSEELGFDTEVKFLWKEYHDWPNETHFAYLYQASYDGQPIQLDPDEADAYQFVTPEEFDDFCTREPVERECARILRHFWLL